MYRSFHVHIHHSGDLLVVNAARNPSMDDILASLMGDNIVVTGMSDFRKPRHYIQCIDFLDELHTRLTIDLLADVSANRLLQSLKGVPECATLQRQL